jgi:pyruvate-ferredoxin/flavodoxin oxidoreductase
MKQQARATASGYWPLFRFDPTMRRQGLNPFRLDSTRPRIPLKDYVYQELRYTSVKQANPQGAAEMLVQAQAVVDEKYRVYEDLASRDGSRFLPYWEDAAQ